METQEWKVRSGGSRLVSATTCRFAGELPSPTSRKVRRFCLLAARTHPCTLAGPRGAEPSNPPMLGGLVE